MSPTPSGGPAAESITFRSFRYDADYDRCWILQEEIWGDFRDRVSPALLRVSQHVGGVAAGAYDEAGELVGFVWGMSGVREGRLAHWSHMLGVRPEHRDRRLGLRLKLFQRQRLQELGVETAYWTFDPLEARNAHLNFNRLGVGVESYVLDYYGSGETSTLHRGLGTDRFIVAWQLAGERTAAALGGRLPERAERFAAAPVVASRTGPGGSPLPEAGPLPDLPAVRVEIPADVQAVKGASPEEARRWRRVTRRAFQTYMARGLSVEAFYRDGATGRCFYLLT